jgi:acyl-CoA thioester hydrolase
MAVLTPENFYQTDLHLRWADFDMMAHLRHSAYYDLCAQARTHLFESFGVGITYMRANHFGPVLFEEHAKFQKEIRMNDPVQLTIELVGLKRDCSQFKVQHRFLGKDQLVHAEVRVFGAYIDFNRRKVGAPPEKMATILQNLPKPDGFEWW